MTVPAIVLAAGASRRLGQPKQLVRVAGEPLLARTVRLLAEADLQPIFVVLGANETSIAAEVDLSATRIVSNPAWQSGISTSIQAGLTALMEQASNAQAAMLLVCDQPRLTRDHLQSLAAAYHEAGASAIVASHYAGMNGIPAIFPASQFPRLLALEGDTGARQLLRRAECPVIEIAFDGGEVDIDTPDDLRAIL